MRKTCWLCWLFGHRIVVVWTDDKRGRFVTMCFRCGERHCYEVEGAKWQN